jgi:hypothetical protein
LVDFGEWMPDRSGTSSREGPHHHGSGKAIEEIIAAGHISSEDLDSTRGVQVAAFALPDIRGDQWLASGPWAPQVLTQQFLMVRATALVLALMVVLGACIEGGEGGGVLRIGGSGELNEGVALGFKVPAHGTFVVGSMPVCPDGGPVTVTGVSTYGGDDIEVTGYALRRNPFLVEEMMLGEALGALEDNDLERAEDLVLDDECGGPDTGDTYELVVELKAAETDQAAEGYVVSWGDDRNLEVPYGLTICVDHALEECRR